MNGPDVHIVRKVDRTFFGGLTGAAADWDKVVKAYEKNGLQH
ncbi:hypothetical protein HaLaN_06134 [Haematococcus lacustris]|uniref:Uncharacterized protein n=1 Tax=Haematococcus lacustris TaxID=44745 RepID=A0A699YMM2_HAELA|nr:hypothetical protein HaLaN_06134 [Haematococcus lacustris]